MKCSKCGYRAKDIAHMAAHYRKSHPAIMKKRLAGKTMSKKKCRYCGR